MALPQEVEQLRKKVAELEECLARERLAASEASDEQFRILADSIPQLAWMADSTGSVFWYNRRWYEYTGTTLEQMRGWGWQSVHHPDHVDRVVERIGRSWNTGEAWEDTFPLRSKTGEWRWFLSRALPIHDSAGRVVRWFGTNTDITEQLESERERERLLHESESSRALLDALFENAPVGLCFWDRELRYTRLNQALADINGIPIQDHLGRTPSELLPGVGDEVMPIFLRVLETGELHTNIEVSGETPAAPGIRRTWLASFYPVWHRETIIGIGSVIHEITDRKRTEEALGRLSERLELHLNNTPVAIIEFDSQFVISRWSPEAARMFGWTSDEVVGRQLNDFGFVYEQDRPLVDNIVRTMTEGNRTSYFCANRNRRKDGVVLNLEWYNSVVRASAGALVSVMSFGVDVTARKQAEDALHRHAEALARSNAELQQFAYAASHDLQEPLRMVSLYTELLRRRYAGRLAPDADIYINYAVSGAMRMEELLRDLLAYSRLAVDGDEHPVSLVDCNAVLRKVLFTLDERIRESGASITSSPLPSVRAREVHLLQLFQNLVSNAVKYRLQSRPPRIEISALKTDGRWLLSVRDNGVGIPKKYQKQVFALFKRLHTRTNSGTGIGLSICQRIVERYGGSIWVESEGDGCGSTFFFTLPLSE